MAMNEVIRSRRRALGLTQEQVAQTLNISVPAVSKWESGATSPDITLLPGLARLLRIDLNTLFGFEMEPSRAEIGALCQEIAELAREKAFSTAFEAAEERLRTYPNSEVLRHRLSFLLSGLLGMSGLPESEAERYDARLDEWFERISHSDNAELRHSAMFMRVSRWIRRGEIAQAQAGLDAIPDRDESLPDKSLLQATIYMQQGKVELAAQTISRMLLLAVNRVQALMYKLMDAELAAGEETAVVQISEKAREMTTVFDLWTYNAYVAPLRVASVKRDAPAAMQLLQSMLDTMDQPWDPASSPLYRRIGHAMQRSDPRQMLTGIVAALERDEECAFLRTCEGFDALLAAFRARAGQASD